MNLVRAFLDHVEAQPGAAAIHDPQAGLVAYADLASAAARRAGAYVQAGVEAGDVVLIARGVSAELYEILLAIFQIGAVAMFPEPSAGLKGLKAAIAMGKPKAMAAGALAKALRLAVPELGRLRVLPEPARGQKELDAIASRPGDAPALITFTSGSTGRPKGIVRSADFLMLQHRLLEEVRRTKPSDVDLISLPVFILSNLAAGATSVLPAGRLTKPANLDGERLRRQIAEAGVNRIVAPPAVCARIAQGATPMEQISAVFTGGGPVFPNLLRSLQRAAPCAAIHAVYGSTEAEPIAHVELGDIRSEDWRAMEAGAGLLAGRPIPEVAVDIRDDEVFVAGPHVNQGYLDPEDDASSKSVRDGVLWHRTGDAARLDEMGRLWLLGRREASLDGLYPFAIETAALSWPGVRQAAFLAGQGRAKLALCGEGLDLSDLKRRAARLGEIDIVRLSSIPMDKRHNSKADYAKLRRLIR